MSPVEDASDTEQPQRAGTARDGLRRKGRKPKGRKPKGASAKAELERRVAVEMTALRRVERLLRRLGPEGMPSEPKEVSRQREALRRRRTRHLLELDRLQRRLTNQGNVRLARNA